MDQNGKRYVRIHFADVYNPDVFRLQKGTLSHIPSPLLLDRSVPSFYVVCRPF